jgi:hypothetical protein
MKYYKKDNDNEIYGFETICEDDGFVEIREDEIILLTTGNTTRFFAPISMRQCRLKLLKMNLLELVETEMQKDKTLSIEWEYATEINIDNPLVLMFSEKLGLTEEARVTMFEEARLL